MKFYANAETTQIHVQSDGATFVFTSSQNLCRSFCTFPIRERLLLEFEKTGELLVDLGSDQTSLHNPFNGGYYPVQLSLRQANQLMATDPDRFRTAVQERLNYSLIIIN